VKKVDHAAMLAEYELLQEIHKAFKELVEQGEFEIVGRLADGEPVYGSTAPAPAVWRFLDGFRVIGIFPALIAEYTLGYSAVALARVLGRTKLGDLMTDIAECLGFWRYVPKQGIWLTIKS
jgi:hypothetical protein